jgi:hypothetical protein
MVAASVVVGLAAGWLIGKWTEYATSDEFSPTKKLADQAVTGPATIIIGGIADGMKSVWFPVIVVGVATILAFGFAASWQFNDVSAFRPRALRRGHRRRRHAQHARHHAGDRRLRPNRRQRRRQRRNGWSRSDRPRANRRS